MENENQEEYLAAIEYLLLWHLKQIKEEEDSHTIQVLIRGASQAQAQLMTLIMQSNTKHTTLPDDLIRTTDRLDDPEERGRLIKELKSGHYDELIMSKKFLEWD